MATTAPSFNEPELTPQEFALARKQTMLNGACDMHLFEKASARQKYVIHQIELTIHSIKEDDLDQ
jgi:hypothetical protein